jgi:hypothetical protein
MEFDLHNNYRFLVSSYVHSYGFLGSPCMPTFYGCLTVASGWRRQHLTRMAGVTGEHTSLKGCLHCCNAVQSAVNDDCVLLTAAQFYFKNVDEIFGIQYLGC